jgi:hypothetical protein
MTLNTECSYAECRLCTVTFVMLSVVMLSVSMTSVVAQKEMMREAEDVRGRS